MSVKEKHFFNLSITPARGSKEHLLNMVNVILEHRREVDDVIKIDQGEMPFYDFKGNIHCPFETFQRRPLNKTAYVQNDKRLGEW